MRNICIFVHLLLLLPSICWQLSGVRTASYPTKKTWKAAQAYCRKHHTDLVIIESETENLLNGRGWIGLHRKNVQSPWKWSRGDKVATFTIWDAVSENPPVHDCVFKYPDTLEWRTDSCSAKHSFMCYDEKLVLVRENKTWEEALHHCRSLEEVGTSNAPDWNPRYDLASLITQDDHAHALEKAQLATTFEVWTGLRFLAGQWVWVGGERVQYKDIRSCPTTKYCGVLEKQGTASFAIKNCEERKNFFCYKRLLARGGM